ncbi:MAG TPA: VWA domain-containing protein [Herpetosiphonaceae bacterium]
MTLLFPIGLLALLALPAILILHLVRQRRTRIKVPTLALWQALAAPTPEHRKRRIPWSWLLALHLLAAACLALALANPALRALFGDTTPEHTALVIDTSTSMGATDESPSRLGQAQADALDAIDELGPGDTLALIELSASPRLLLTGGPDEAPLLEQAVRRLRAAGNGADLPGALQLAGSTFRPGQENRVLLLTDDALAAPASTIAVAAELERRTYGGNSANAAIVAFASRRLPDGDVALYGRVVNWDDAPAIRTLRLVVDGRQRDEQAIRVPEQGATEYTWRVDASSALAELSLSGGDALPGDDLAALPLTQARTVRVRLIGPPGSALERVLAVLPGLQVTAAQTVDPAAPPADVTILNGVLPDALPPGALLLVNPPDDPRLPANPINANARAAAAASDPAFAGVDLSSVQLRRVIEIRPGTAFSGTLAPAISAAGSNLGLVLRGSWQGRQTVIWAFDLEQSNLPVKLAFPLLTAASLQALASGNLPPTLPPGSPAPAVGLLAPGGAALAADARLDQPGFYRVAGNDEAGGVAVNLGDTDEANLAPRPAPNLDAAPGAVTIAQPEETRRQLWPPLVALALLAVAAEWYLLYRPRPRRAAAP